MKTLQKITLGLAILGTTSLLADGASLFKRCAGCHGVNAEKAALGKSQIIKGWEASKTVAALKGYKDGTYGGAMKGVMKGQVTTMSEADMQEIGEYIATK
jgi:cytochrome c